MVVEIRRDELNFLFHNVFSNVNREDFAAIDWFDDLNHRDYYDDFCKGHIDLNFRINCMDSDYVFSVDFEAGNFDSLVNELKAFSDRCESEDIYRYFAEVYREKNIDIPKNLREECNGVKIKMDVLADKFDNKNVSLMHRNKIVEKFYENIGGKKYELLDSEETFEGKPLYQIQALKDFKTIVGKEIKAGDLGGFVESEANLSQQGTCWVEDGCAVCERAFVFENAYIDGPACYVTGEAEVFGNARVYACEECVHGNAQIGGNAQILDSASIGGYAQIMGNAIIYGDADIYGSSVVMDSAEVGCGTAFWGRAIVSGSAKIGQDDKKYFSLRDEPEEICVGGETEIKGDVCISEPINIYGQCFEKQEDFEKFKNLRMDAKNKLAKSVENADRSREQRSPTKEQVR